MFLSRCRKTVDTYAPPLGLLYRLSRDVTHRHRSVQTQYGFSLAGEPAMAHADWETNVIQTFLEYLETHDVILDIGSNVGFYSCLAASRGKQTIAIEPSPRNLNLLYKNLWNNQITNAEVFPLGLAGQCGLRRMYGYGGISSFVPGWAQANEEQSIIVPMSTLDTITAGRFGNKNVLIKMDVEGFELDVLSGASKTLDRYPKPTWLVEILLQDEVIPGGISNNFRQTFEIFWRYGYSSWMLNAERTPVDASDIDRWIRNGVVEFGTHDFLFSAD